MLMKDKMIELTLTPEFSHLHLRRLNDKQEYLLSLDGTALTTNVFAITFTNGEPVLVHIDTRLDYLHNKEVFTFTFRTQPYPFYMKHFDNVRKFCDVNEKIDKEKHVAHFKQSKFDRIKGRKNVAKPSKFFLK